MSDQFPDDLTILDRRVPLEGLGLYGVIIGPVDPLDPELLWGTDNYPLPLPPMPTEGPRSLYCHRGYIAQFVLHETGALELRSFQRLGGPVESVRMFLTGDFWLVMRPEFRAFNIYVPFRGGHVCADHSQWIRDCEESQEARRLARRAKRPNGAG